MYKQFIASASSPKYRYTWPACRSLLHTPGRIQSAPAVVASFRKRTTDASLSSVTFPCNRGKNGHLSIELAVTAIFFTVFAFLTADLGYVLYGAYFNDRACRDAARAAAQAPNLTDANKKVNAVLRSHQGNPALMTGPLLDRAIVYQDFGGTPPSLTSPFVTVTTTTRINLPLAPITFMGGATFGRSGRVGFTQSYTFPIVRVR